MYQNFNCGSAGIGFELYWRKVDGPTANLAIGIEHISGGNTSFTPLHLVANDNGTFAVVSNSFYNQFNYGAGNVNPPNTSNPGIQTSGSSHTWNRLFFPLANGSGFNSYRLYIGFGSPIVNNAKIDIAVNGPNCLIGDLGRMYVTNVRTAVPDMAHASIGFGPNWSGALDATAHNPAPAGTSGGYYSSNPPQIGSGWTASGGSGAGNIATNLII